MLFLYIFHYVVVNGSVALFLDVHSLEGVFRFQPAPVIFQVAADVDIALTVPLGQLLHLGIGSSYLLIGAYFQALFHFGSGSLVIYGIICHEVYLHIGDFFYLAKYLAVVVNDLTYGDR